MLNERKIAYIRRENIIHVSRMYFLVLYVENLMFNLTNRIVLHIYVSTIFIYISAIQIRNMLIIIRVFS